MKSLQKRIKEANGILSTLAVPIEGTLGRQMQEEPDPTRFAFQRDRDRIVHTQSFRRLKGKTQVFVCTEGDHYRTRLTHTMEVAQISRDMARTLSLNEDLAECIALAHDLGHPPFGHAGEDALNNWMQTQGSHFEHNEQSLRIVQTLEHRSNQYAGLNLNQEVLEGLIKHRTPHDSPAVELPRSPTLEAQIVNLADEIAYTGHDIEDGLRAGLFTLEDLAALELTAQAHAASTEHETSLRGALIHALVMDVYAYSSKRIEELNLKTLDDVYACKEVVIAFSDSMRKKIDALRQFLWSNMYLHPSVAAHADAGKEIVTKLCTHLLAHPSSKVLDLQQRHESPLPIAVKDYVAGMTDAYAAQSTTP